ncbi:hypothetical protein GCM10027036_07830 [Flavihumibacter cheonanensis]|uniref:hypothetical protein n=1 Tax=Flavihumibacter cheonanensis TaxID=1442385 RepID=UPI001EF96A94|nr:hypothetical protein [Flavihumibacter cheonanensis]MCG7751775.1 hypothetical protein [Flavihumibacter cheonanensis]
MKHEYLETSVWFKDKITDPYQIIAAFFDAADIAHHRKIIKNILQVACSERCWEKQVPGHLLYEFSLLESVINAAWVLDQEKKKDPLFINPEDVFNPNLFVGWHGKLTKWDFLPRSLSYKEFANPYRVFKRFFRFQDIANWKEQLQLLMDYSLRSMNLLELEDIRPLSLYFQLTKLVEAAHLIDVREVNHVGGHVKNRISKRRL